MKRNIFFKGKALFLIFVLVAVIVIGSLNVTASTAFTGMRGITAAQAVSEMKLGWNLGNTMDAPSETGWGNPATTHAMIDKIKQQGFNTLRLPVTWDTHIGGSPSYTINSAWLDRVEAIANYAFDNNMYVIINTHHETTWVIPTTANQTAVTAKLTAIWTQIANRFKNYGDYLIFETLNEPRLANSPEEWTGGTAEGRDMVNKYNLAAVNAIRATGGNNSTRFIMCPTYAASATSVAINAWVAPNNDSRVITSVHMYSPYSFAMDVNGTSSWGTSSDMSSLDSEFDAVYNVFGRNGRSVVLGEFGTINKNNLSSRVAHAEYYVKSAKARGMTCCWWDNNLATVAGETYGIFNRSALTWYFPDIANALVRGAGGTSTPTPTVTSTPTPTRINTPTPTSRRGPTATPTPTQRRTPSPTTRATATPTRGATPTPTRGTNTPTPPPPTGTGYNYAVAYVIQSDWGNGGTISVTITNRTTSAVNGWTLAFTFPGNQTITNLWNGTYTQSGASVSVKDGGFNANIPANGGSVNVGFNINYSGTNAKPGAFTLNGVACQVQ